MHSKNLQKLTILLMACGFSFIFSSCEKEEDPIAAPDAAFEVAIDGKTITLTNTTTVDTTKMVDYAWDFGDGSTSTQKAPTHTYEANGSYLIKLTATNVTGSDNTSSAVEIINITIDGNLSDWDDVASVQTYTDGEGRSLMEVKLENLGKEKLFVYVKGTQATQGFVDLFINVDNAETGFTTAWYPLSPGFDLLYEGFVLNPTPFEFAPFFGKDDPSNEPADWGWLQLSPSGTFLTASTIQNVSGGKAYEFAIDMTQFPSELTVADVIQIAIADVYAPVEGDTQSWSSLGTFPQRQEERTGPVDAEGNITLTAKAIEYTLK